MQLNWISLGIIKNTYGFHRETYVWLLKSDFGRRQDISFGNPDAGVEDTAEPDDETDNAGGVHAGGRGGVLQEVDG